MYKLIWLLLLLPFAGFSQDTTRIEVVGEFIGFRIFDVEEDRLLVLRRIGNGEHEGNQLTLYDISDPFQPDLMGRFNWTLFARETFEVRNVHRQEDAIFWDDMILTSINLSRFWGSNLPGQIIGPFSLTLYEPGNQNAIWEMPLTEEISELDSLFEGLTDYKLIGDVVRCDDYAYVACGSWGIRIVEMSNPAQPVLVDTLSYVTDRLIINGDRMVMFHEIDESLMLALLDVSNPEEPELISETEIDSEIGPDWYELQYGNMQIYENYLYASNQHSQDPAIVVFDVESDDAPQEVRRFKLPSERPWGNGYPVIVNFYIHNDSMYVKHFPYLDIYSLEDPLEPEYARTSIMDTGEELLQIVVRGDVMYAAQAFRFRSWDEEVYIKTFSLEPMQVEEKNPEKLSEFYISNVYPNPCNSSTTITYELPVQSTVSLAVYNIRGQLVEVLSDQVMPAGKHSVFWDAGETGAGVYLLSMKDEGGRMRGMRKIVLMK